MKTVKKKNRTPLVLGIAVLVLVLVSSMLSIRARQARTRTQYDFHTVAEGTILQTVSGTGRVTATNKEIVFAGSGGQIRAIAVAVGSSVNQGDLLVRTASGAEIFAPITGEVSGLFVKENEWVNPGARLLEIVDYDSLEISAFVDELDIARITEGQTARIDINALTNEDISGKITSIAREGTTTPGGITTFSVRVSLPDTTGMLIGMSAEIRVETARSENVLVVPVQAVFYDGQSPFILLRPNEGVLPQEQPVELGLSDGRHVEVKSGVNVGDTVAYRRTAVDNQRNFGPPFGRTR